MKRILYILIGIITVLFGLTFAIKNAQMVTVAYYFGVKWDARLALVLLITLALGILVGYIAGLRKLLRLHRQLVQARREIRQVEQEVSNLRAMPIRDVL